MDKTFQYVADRLNEEGTHAGIAGILAVAGAHVPDATLQAVIHTLAAVFGLVAVLTQQKAK